MTTSGYQTYSGAVTLGAGTTLTTTNNNITFGSTLNSDISNRSFAVSAGSGTLRFSDAVGSNYALGVTTINAGVVIADSTFSTVGITGITTTTSSTGTQTYTGAVTIGAASSFISSNSNISFSSTLNSASTTAQALTVSAGTGTVQFANAVGYLRAVGLSNITGGTITFSDAFYSTGNTTITGNTVQTTAAKVFSVISSANLTINADALTIGAALTGSSDGTLTIQPRTASTTMGVGTSAAGTLSLDDTELGYINGKFGSLILGSTSGTALITVDYASPFTYTQPLTIRSSSTGSVTASDTLNTGTNSLTISSGAVTTNNLAEIISGNLSITGTAISLNNNVTTSGTQSYVGPVTLTNSITLDSTTESSAGRAIGFTGTGTINGTSSNTQALTFNSGTSGTIAVAGAIGGSVTLSSLTIAQSGVHSFSVS
jgi:predicted regulator of Ras-like GTPase activity (Roadblock/LC7/MglB family)